MISIIAAMAKNNVIGYQGKMPWRLPAELAYFKKSTLDKTLLMGRRTFNSIGRPLPDRRNWVLSQQADLHLPGCEIYSSLQDVWQKFTHSTEELMVIGGGNLYQQVLPLADRLYLTFIECEPLGDTFFPAWNPDEWREIKSSFHPADQFNSYAFKTIEYEKLI